LNGFRSSLASVAPMAREPQPEHARRAARDAWHAQGIVLINPDWLAGWADRQQLIILADKVHGKRPSHMSKNKPVSDDLWNRMGRRAAIAAGVVERKGAS
jgi:hypothetical protein